ncbi:hypothetical protein GCM10023151_07370 [Kangiella marina]|uniref:Uncharacterized protein n=1 Tax=Kangiella marina TaxID=1079178 RepID=A0ABP8IG15_9GAMM
MITPAFALAVTNVPNVKATKLGNNFVFLKFDISPSTLCNKKMHYSCGMFQNADAFMTNN